MISTDSYGMDNSMYVIHTGQGTFYRGGINENKCLVTCEGTEFPQKFRTVYLCKDHADRQAAKLRCITDRNIEVLDIGKKKLPGTCELW